MLRDREEVRGGRWKKDHLMTSMAKTKKRVKEEQIFQKEQGFQTSLSPRVS